MMNYDEAVDLILSDIPPNKGELIQIMRATGCVLKEDISSDIDIPPFNKSAVDGYAVRSEDLQNVPASFKIVGDSIAGKRFEGTLSSGEAVRIQTGAPVPDEADAVVMKEFAEESQDRKNVLIKKSAQAGDNICFKGEDARQDEIVLKEGCIIRPQEIGILALLGRVKVTIYKKPTVCIINSGDELVDPSETPDESQIRNSNGYLLCALLSELGLPYAMLGITQDKIELLTAKIREGLKADVLIITGGLSAGDYDFVREVLQRENVNLKITKVKIKPGKPFIYGRKDKTVVFGLPGNPVSTFVTYQMFVLPALKKMMGYKDVKRKFKKFPLKQGNTNVNERTQFLLAYLDAASDGNSWVKLIDWNGSGDLISLNKANCFIVIEASKGPYKAGDLVDVLQL